MYKSLNPQFQADTKTACPSCGKTALETGYQPFLLKDGGYHLTHCKNPDCKGYALTLEHSSFLKEMLNNG